MMQRHVGLGSLLASLAVALAAPAQGDPSPATGAVSLRDGRFVFGKPIEQKKDGVVIKYSAGDVFVPATMVKDCFSSAAGFKYQPKNDQDRAKLAKGLIPFNGTWMTRSRAEKEIAKLEAKLHDRIEKEKEYKLWRNRRKVETRTFKFEHNLPPELFENLKTLLEVYYKTFTRYWKMKTKLPNKPTINLYADHGDFDQISGAGGGVVGWYHPLTNQLHVFWDRTDPAFTIDVLFHEANHMLSDMVNGKFRYGHWIEEAMAEYYGASQWDPVKKKMSIGFIQAGRLQEIKSDIARDHWMKLDDLIGSRSYSSYNWGWSFVHFMMQTPKYREKWRKYWVTLAHGRGVRRESSYGEFRECSKEEQKRLLLKILRIKKLDTLQKEWYAYIKKLEVDDVTGLQQAGRKLRQMGKYDEARKYLAQAIAKGAKNPYTYAAYADVLIKNQDRSKALSMIGRAIALDPLEPEFYYMKGQILARGGAAKNKAKAKKWFKLAAEMDPESWTYAAAAAEN